MPPAARRSPTVQCTVRGPRGLPLPLSPPLPCPPCPAPTAGPTLQVPTPINTATAGAWEATRTGDRMDWTLEVVEANQVTMAHIHLVRQAGRHHTPCLPASPHSFTLLSFLSVVYCLPHGYIASSAPLACLQYRMPVRGTACLSAVANAAAYHPANPPSFLLALAATRVPNPRRATPPATALSLSSWCLWGRAAPPPPRSCPCWSRPSPVPVRGRPGLAVVLAVVALGLVRAVVAMGVEVAVEAA